MVEIGQRRLFKEILKEHNMTNLFKLLIELLGKNKNYIAEDEKILKNKVIEDALSLSPNLIKILLTEPVLKEYFFENINEVLVFDKIKFQRFVSNKNFLPDSYTSYTNKIGLSEDDKTLISSKQDVTLVWPHKDCILEGGQTKEDQKRKEIFWNETLAPAEIDRLLSPKVLTNFQKYDSTGMKEVKEISQNDNLIVKGNNLLALHSLKKQYARKVKLIYIDPPYNTGNDSFGYNDSFNHSTWLTFMKNRLEVARKLLTDNGVIVLHCDYIEGAYVKVLMDEIFGRNNYVNDIVVKDSHPSGLKLAAKNKTIIKTKSMMLVYKKSTCFIEPIYQKREKWDKHFNTFVETQSKELVKHSLKTYIEKFEWKDFVLDVNALKHKDFKEFAFAHRNQIFQSTKEIPQSGKELSLEQPDIVVEYKPGEYAFNGRRLSPLSKSIHSIGFDGYFHEDFAKLLCDFWDDLDFNNSQNEGGISFPAGKKPELLIARIISMFTNKADIVLDYHLGSGTTAAVAHKMGRQYIGIEQLDYGKNDSVVRLKNVINGEQSGISTSVNWKNGGSFICCELMKWNQKYIEKIEKAKTTAHLIEIWNQIKANGFLSYQVKPNEIDQSIKDFEELSFENQQIFLVTTLDKNHLYVNYSEKEDEEFEVTELDKALNSIFYGRR